MSHPRWAQPLDGTQAETSVAQGAGVRLRSVVLHGDDGNIAELVVDTETGKFRSRCHLCRYSYLSKYWADLDDAFESVAAETHIALTK